MMKHDFLIVLRNDFRAFSHFLFNEAHPGQPFSDGWYLDVVADALMRVTPGSGERLMLNLPPRSLKSFMASVAWPLFLMARVADLKVTIITGTQELAIDLSEIRARLLRPERLLQVFPSLRARAMPGGALRFDSGGTLSQSFIGRPQIGRGADVIIIDDPLTPIQAEDPSRRADVNAWYAAEAAPRLNSQGGVVVIVMQRLHQGDLCGHLKRGAERWREVVLPAIARDNERWVLSTGLTRTRRAGEALCVSRADLPSLRAQLERVGAINFAAQYLQRPINLEGLPRGVSHRIKFIPPLIALPGHEHRKPPAGGFHAMTFMDDILAGYFGQPHPLDRSGFRPHTSEENERLAIEQQAALLASVRADMERR